MTATVMQIANEITAAHNASRMLVAIRSSKHAARILGVDTMQVFADTELTEDQARSLRVALRDEFGAVTRIGR